MAAEVARSGAQDSGDSMISCLRSTRAGDRAVIYQSRGDQAIVSVFDFYTDAFPHPDLRWTGWGRATELGAPISRDVLLVDPILEKDFRHIMGRRSLSPTAARRIAEIADDWPPRAQLDDPPPDPDELVEVRWTPAGPWITWGLEKTMQHAIASHEPSWRQLGFSKAPQLEVHPPNSDDRIDLYGEEGVIAECKLFGDSRALRQLDRYLEPLNRHRPVAGKTGWHGTTVVAQGYTPQVAEQLIDRPETALFVCLRTPGDEPRLVEVTDPLAELPFPDARAWTALANIGESLLLGEEAAGLLATMGGVDQQEVEEIMSGEIDWPTDEEYGASDPKGRAPVGLKLFAAATAMMRSVAADAGGEIGLDDEDLVPLLGYVPADPLTTTWEGRVEAFRQAQTTAWEGASELGAAAGLSDEEIEASQEPERLGDLWASEEAPAEDAPEAGRAAFALSMAGAILDVSAHALVDVAGALGLDPTDVERRLNLDS